MCQLSAIRGLFNQEEPDPVQYSEEEENAVSSKQKEAAATKTTEGGKQCVDDEIGLESSFSGVVRYRSRP